MIYAICLVGAWVIWHLLYRFRVMGRANLPRRQKGAPGYVMICNHLAATDAVFVYLARFGWPKPLILAKAELFDISPVLSWFFKSVGAVPVVRGKGDTATLDAVVTAVRAGRDVVVFPEGTRSKTGQLQTIKSGAFVIAAAAGAPVVPCRILYQDGRPRIGRRVCVAIGQPLDVQTLGLDGASTGASTPGAAVLRGAKAQCVAAMETLYQQGLPLVCPGRQTADD